MTARLREFLARLTGAFRPDRAEADLHDEIREHLRLLAEAYERRGLSPDDARRAARLEFGNPVSAREACGDQRGLPSLDSFAQDLRHGLRLLRRSPGFTLTAVLTLAVGIGVNTTIFTAVDAVALHPLPVKDGDRLVRVERWLASGARGDIQFAFSEPEVHYLTEALVRRHLGEGDTVFTDIVAAGWMMHADEGSGERARVQFVSSKYFDALGVVPAAGGTTLGGDGTEAGVVLSHPFWIRRFQGDRAIAGRTVTLNGASFTITGVASESFIGTANPPEIPDVWAPIAARARMGFEHAFSPLQLLAHVQPGLSRGAAQQRMASLVAAFGQAFPSPDQTTRLTLERASYFGETNDPRFQSFVAAGLAVVGLVLLIACANLANMLLARGTARHREIAMRLALGASRRRIFRQLLTESTLLALFGGAAGFACSLWTARLFWLLIAEGVLLFAHGDVSPLSGLTPGLPVFLFTCAVTFAAAAAFGVVPALRLSTPDLNAALKDERPLSGRVAGAALRRWFVAAQVAISMALLLAAGLLLRGFVMSQTATTGYDTSRLFDVGYSKGDDPARARQVQARIVETLARTDGMRVMLVDHLPLAGTWTPPMTSTTRSGKIAGRTLANRVSPEYFETLGATIVRGDTFRADAGDAAVAVVSEAAARRFWPGEDPLGREFTLDMNFRGKLQTFHVIGIARDVRTASLSRIDPAFVYLPLTPTGFNRVMVRTSMPPRQAVPAIRRAVASVDPKLLNEGQVLSLDDGPLRLWHAMVDTLVGFAGTVAVIALALTLGGIYGVVAYLASLRRYEIGVRLALGASRADVLWLVLADGLSPVAAGAGAGLVLAAAVSALLRASLSFPGTPDVLFGVSAFDVVTFGGVTALLALVALAASAGPLWRATRVDPIVTLRRS
jgi:predicted permease